MIKMKNWLKENWFKAGIILLGLLIVVPVIFLSYRYVTKEVKFNRNQECAVYKSQIEDKFEENKEDTSSPSLYNFKRIFYSPRKDSCLFIYDTIIISSMSFSTYLEDALTGETISHYEYQMYGGEKIFGKDKVVFDEIVREYEK
jgi:hypothetical protein